MYESKLRPHTGINLFQLHFEKVVGKSQSVKFQWERMMKGYSPLFCFVTKDMLVMERMMRRSWLDSTNIFRWVVVKLICLWIGNCDSTLPWVFKIRKDDSITIDIYIYIDDGRSTTTATWEY